MMPTRRGLIAAIAVSLGLLSLPSHAQTAPKVVDAWARPTVAGQPGGGAFATLIGGTAPDRLLGARAEIAKDVQLHSMTMDGNVMHMHAVPGIDVPAGRTVALAPGGYHLMFSGLKRPLVAGKHFPLTLHFEKAGDVTVDVQVRLSAMTPMGSMPAGQTMPMK